MVRTESSRTGSSRSSARSPRPNVEPTLTLRKTEFCRSFQLVSEVGDKAAGLGSQFVNGAGGGNVERCIVGIAPIQVSRLLGHLDGSKMMTLRIPNPNAFRASDIEVARF